MDKPWFQKLFHRAARSPDLQSTRAKADDGDAEAQFSLGLRFSTGTGSERDEAQAAQWYLKAADQNHAMAQFNLGIMLADGQGVPQDDVKALMWLNKAAGQGDAAAQHNLGMRQQRASLGAPTETAMESKLEAYKWLRLASAQGYRGSDAAFECVALTMTREQIADGNHRMDLFVAANPNLVSTS